MLPPGVPLPPGSRSSSEGQGDEPNTSEDTLSASGWSIVASPNHSAAETVDFLSNVECVSPSDCWAVGYYSGGRYTGGVDMKTLVQHWDGTAWSIAASPNPTDIAHNYLTDVACSTSSDCWAVGYYEGESKRQTLIEHWDGTAWTIVESPNTTSEADNLLHGVTCTSATDCWAVGYYSTPTGAQTLTEHWDGSAWTIVGSPNGEQISPLAATPWGASVLYDVTCVSSTDCWAVGNFYNGFADQTLIERWDGTAWTIVGSPNVTPTVANYLYGVTCVSASDCWAVGTYAASPAGETLIAHWDGNLWTLAVSANAPGSNALYGVTCASASNCWAVGATDLAGSLGQTIAGRSAQTLIQHWDGTRWAVTDSPNTSAAQPNVVSGVECLSASDCWTVGWSGGFAFETLIERWDGTSWVVVVSPNARADADHVLSDVTCVSVSDCWAVGYHFADNARQALIEHWDGTEWSIATSATKSSDFDHYLNGVTCRSASDCWAVGYHNFGSTWQTLVEHWDGTAWTIIDSPSTSETHFNVLSSVTCMSASDCWAAGSYSVCYYCPGSAWQTLILHWDGTSWSIVDSPNTSPGQSNTLSDVTCTSASDCWAAGSYNVVNQSSGTSHKRTLIAHWDGAAWTRADSPNTAARNNALEGLTCVSASECWASGSSSTGESYEPDTVTQTLIARWDGISWAIVDSPNPSPGQTSLLSDVTCVSASDCWAVGSYSGTGALQTLIEHWDGISWVIVDSPNTSDSQSNALSGVTCASTSRCWTVGSYNAGLIAQTLTEAYIAD